MGVPDEAFDAAMAAVKRKHGAVHDVDLDAERAAGARASAFLDVYREHTGEAFPADPYEQLERSIEAVFRSWNGKRAVDYRRAVPDHAGDGQRHRGQRRARWCSATWATTRRPASASRAIPATGENVIYGEYLVNAQGEDVVAGIRTPKPIAAMAQEMPALHRQLVELRDKLEAHYKEVQDFEFTIETRPALLPADAQRQDERARDGGDLGRDVSARA